jgi:hypothetical protein
MPLGNLHPQLPTFFRIDTETKASIHTRIQTLWLLLLDFCFCVFTSWANVLVFLYAVDMSETKFGGVLGRLVALRGKWAKYKKNVAKW